MTKATKAIFSTSMLIAVLIAGWAFLRDERAKSLNPASTATPESPQTDTTAEIDTQMRDIDKQMELLNEDYANIEETMTETVSQPDSGSAAASK